MTRQVGGIIFYFVRIFLFMPFYVEIRKAGPNPALVPPLSEIVKILGHSVTQFDFLNTEIETFQRHLRNVAAISDDIIVEVKYNLLLTNYLVS